jgi:uncharacterized membrane protein
MRHLFDALHILFAIFAVGPLVHAATTAARGIREGDAKAIATSSQTVRRYGYASLLVVVFGMGLVQSKYGYEFSDIWIWLALLLYVIALALVLVVLAPGLDRAGRAVAVSGPTERLVARVAAAGGVVALLFATIVVLMVYKPGK